MANVPQAQWDRVYRELTQLLASRSPLRHLGEGPIDTMAGFELNVDGMTHFNHIKTLAEYGYPPALALLQEVAGAAGDPRYPDRQDDALLATAILAGLAKPGTDATNLSPTQSAPRTAPAPAPAQLPVVYQAPEPAPAVVNSQTVSSRGEIIGNAFDALHALLGEAELLSDADKTTFAALISVLNTKIGVTGK